ncbi:MAG: SDR family oxidoreductase [candidate division Zixibacteria bacterium]|nr:SDR family oxidoreductase [candidate division Zixibacteria bacterium]
MQNILVTGSSKGIGQAIAIALAADKTHLFIHGRDKKALDETENLVKDKGSSCSQIIADISTTSGCNKLIEAVGQETLTVLVNNAAVGIVKPVDELTLDDWNRTIAVNVTAPFILTKELLPQMKKGSSIVNILSTAAKNAFSGWSSYCMSKFALRGFSETLREELRPRGIRVIAVYPGAVDTSIWDSVPGDWPREKMMQAEEVAQAVAFAVSCPPDVLIEDITMGNLAGSL